jgi:hypothetical protein
MRVSIGLGFIAMISLVACTAPGGTTDKPAAGGPNGSTADPNEPGAAGGPADPEKAPLPIVSNLAVTDVAVFQGVKVAVVKNCALVAPAKRNAPVVAKRPGLIRVYVKPGAGWTPREVTAEVRLVSDDETFGVLRETKTIEAASKDDDPESTFNIEVPAEDLPPGVTFQVVLTAPDGETVKEGDTSEGRFPADGSFEALGAEASGKLKVVLVPVRYDTDGSSRTPNVDAAQLERYKKKMMALYPASEVEITTHAPYPWTTTISGNGAGFSSVLQAMHRLRQRDKVGPDVYYYGLLTPASSMSSFCQGGCVAGLSTVADEDTPVLRASVGLGYVGEDSALTMAHEIGHAHGREHAPCGGAADVDPDYPYPQAQIGVWGYDIFDKALISPTKGRDMMGYCQNEWISDYTYKALFERIVVVNKATDASNAAQASSGSQTQQAFRYRMASVGSAGQLSWDGAGDIDLDADVDGRGSIVAARYLSESGAEIMTRAARFFRFDHLPGGLLFVPQDTTVPWASVRIDGYRQQLRR